MDVNALRRHATDLGFHPQDQVRWLSPGELARSAVVVGLGAVFADYTDRRESQAALPAPPLEVRPDDDGGLWWDFTADTGDGFNSTFTVVSLLASSSLDVATPEGENRQLPRGRLLVLGGDEVYPVSSTRNYENRLKGLLRAALPPGSVAPPPWLFALPGNHDWYDGLTAFLRVFAQRRNLGGWDTGQTRSYFAIRLPARWWLVGVDTQLGKYIDGPQLEYFREHLSAQLQPGDGVIVCLPQPVWVQTATQDPDAFNSAHFFEREFVRTYTDDSGHTRETGARVRLWLTGDHHHYARYAEDVDAPQTRQLITCGIGGAYLMATHWLPERLELPPRDSRVASPDEPVGFDLKARWPDVAESRRRVFGVLAGPPGGLAFRNPGLWRLLGTVQAVLLVALAFVLGLVEDRSPVEVLRYSAARSAVDLGWQTATWLAVILGVALLLPVFRGKPVRRPPEGLWAVALQGALAFAAFAVALLVPWPDSWPDWVVLGTTFVASIAVTGLVACYALAVYLLGSGHHMVRDWQMSAQSVEDRKGFLRIRIEPDGRLIVHPLGVDTVCRDWEVEPVAGTVSGAPGAHVRPVPAEPLPRPHLLEEPIVVEREWPGN